MSIFTFNSVDFFTDIMDYERLLFFLDRQVRSQNKNVSGIIAARIARLSLVCCRKFLLCVQFIMASVCELEHL